MSAQSLFSGHCSNLITPLYTKLQNPLSSSSYSLSYPCFIRSKHQVSFKLQYFPASERFMSVRRLTCSNSVEKVSNIVSEKEGSKSWVKRRKLAVFVSGGGSNFRSINQACIAGSINGDVVVLVTNKHACGGAQYARDKGIPVILFPKRKDELNGLSSDDLVKVLREFEVDFILLAGYLKLVPPELIRAYPRFIFNIHPSLLPAFGGEGYYGMKVHKAVIASGARYSGATIHFVDEQYDTGRILAQKAVPVLAIDTAEELAARVLREEHKLYVEVTAALCEDRIVWREDGVPLIRSKENPEEYY
ncbi:Phosphoribosylglycinamide formyltransferase [Hibiscus syriacus]|uniref:Phosphoribosylglycinamide formyltransferase, chloroplastic n=1 Tax=Hibiscus syriacus TaxID=106335 RepID=A0A6A2ZCL2_HIBSY|nr:phosphoribosylglycinamide formyltransferase, chloroplastic-like [Hibiscus syriacus]KAE8689678.1 Phosphoribosylglycinamide formyltransferase [Hibiscus syriacus]